MSSLAHADGSNAHMHAHSSQRAAPHVHMHRCPSMQTAATHTCTRIAANGPRRTCICIAALAQPPQAAMTAPRCIVCRTLLTICLALAVCARGSCFECLRTQPHHTMCVAIVHLGNARHRSVHDEGIPDGEPYISLATNIGPQAESVVDGHAASSTACASQAPLSSR